MKTVAYPFFSIAHVIDGLFNRSFPIPSNVDKNIKIFVFQHFNTRLPECFADRTMYIPIDAGRILHEPVVGTIGDDTEPSISALNPFLNEMTAIFWIGKHYAEIGNPEYVGFAHYRRCLDWSPDLLKPNTVFASLFASSHTNIRFFADCHGLKWLSAFMDRFGAELDDEYLDADRFWNSHFMYIANNFVTDRETFMRYFKFIEKCLAICADLLEKHTEEFAKMSPTMKRQFSYIMERMTGYWIWHERRNRRVNVISSRLKCYAIDNNQTSVR